MGVSALPHCYEGIFCKPINYITKSMVYWDSIQSHVGPAGYFRDPNNLEGYLENSHFLAEVNNEKNFNESRKEKVYFKIYKTVI
jgi:palmitoyl-protein thioesterase